MISILIKVAWFNDWKYMFCIKIISITKWIKKSVTLARVHWAIKYRNHLICTYVLISPVLCAQFHICIWYTSLFKFSLLEGHFLWTSKKKISFFLFPLWKKWRSIFSSVLNIHTEKDKCSIIYRKFAILTDLTVLD